MQKTTKPRIETELYEIWADKEGYRAQPEFGDWFNCSPVYLADIEAEKRFGISSYAELIAYTGSVYTFRFITMPHITVGYGTYDATRDAWIN